MTTTMRSLRDEILDALDLRIEVTLEPKEVVPRSEHDARADFEATTRAVCTGEP